VRATDTLGNTSTWVESTEASITDPPPTGDDTTPVPPPTNLSPHLTLASVKRSRAGIVVAGRIASAATGGVTVTYRTKIGSKAVLSRRSIRLARGGRFRTSLRLPSKARKSRRGTVVMKYRGDTRFVAQAVTRVVVAR
jgi:hypothetical protein